MSEHQNKETLSSISAGLSTFHIWLAMAYGWFIVLNSGFFGTGWGGWLIAGLVLILLLNPGTAIAIARLVLRPLIHNALAHHLVSDLGCLSGIVLFLCIGAYMVWALTRDLTSAIWAFLLAPPSALIFALIVTFLLPFIRRTR